LRIIHPVVIICTSDIQDMVRSIASLETVIYGTSTLKNISCIQCPVGDIDVGIICGMINNSVVEYFRSVGVKSFISTTYPRRLHHSWEKRVVYITHSQYGGVTDHHQHFHHFFLGERSDRSITSFLQSRDAYTIIDDSIWAKRKLRAPVEKVVRPLRVKNVGTDRAPIIHIGGLLPHSDIDRCVVYTPSIGLDRNTWGIRRLSYGEKIDSLDMDRNLFFSRVSRNSQDKLLNCSPITVIPCLSWMMAIHQAWRGPMDVTLLPRRKIARSASPLPEVRLELDSSSLLKALRRRMVKI